jgi:TolB protein
LRDGSPQLYDLNLDHLGNPQDSTALRLTNLPNVECASPVWSPDGKQIAYSGLDTSTGLHLVYVISLAQTSAAPTVVGPGRDPAWSPTGQSLLSAVDSTTTTTLIASQVGTYGVAATTIALDLRTGRPDWTPAVLPPLLLQNPPPRDPVMPPLYALFNTTPTPGSYDKLAVILPDAPEALLSERVADSFLQLRQAARAKTGLDFLGSQLSLWWAIQGANRHLPDPGQSLQNWHYAGRAFDFERNLVYSSAPDQPPPVEIMREDNADGQTYWHVYVRVAESLQTGALGEPLKRLPWDLASRSSQDPQAYQNGGRLKATVPTGYYVDFTALAADYGWSRIPADREWRGLSTGLLYWEFDQRSNLAWSDAMQQLYPPDQVAAFLTGPTPVPTPRTVPTSAVTRTPTPIPPDQVTH